MPVRFTYELLLEVMKRDDASLDLSIYTDKTKINREIRIQGICKCGNNFNKTFRNCYENSGMYCKDCTWNKRSVKIEQTTFTNWGVSNISKLDSIKKSKEESCIKTTGYKYPMQSPKIREQYKETMNDLYYADNPMHCSELKERQHQTVKDRYDVDNISQLEEVKQKKIETNLKNRGVEHNMQDPISHQKQLDSGYRYKEFLMPSGDIRIVQGYEPQALTLLLQTYKEEDILTGSCNVPEIWYTSDKKRRHYVDIYIKSTNTCIEVKSTWTYEKDKKINHLKKQAAKDLELNYEIWVMNEKGSILQKIV